MSCHALIFNKKYKIKYGNNLLWNEPAPQKREENTTTMGRSETYHRTLKARRQNVKVQSGFVLFIYLVRRILQHMAPVL